MSENVQSKSALTSRQVKSIDALMSGMNFAQAATAAGVNEKTLRRWRDEEHFTSALQRRTNSIMGDATRRLTGSLDAAVETMREVMEDAKVAPGVRLRAADYIVSHAIKLVEINDVLLRLQALEESVGI